MAHELRIGGIDNNGWMMLKQRALNHCALTNRANWVLESCLEWKKETDAEIPKELLHSFTRNLFQMDSVPKDCILNPADELASVLLGSSSKLKLKVGENELQFDKPGKIPNTIKTKSIEATAKQESQ